MRRIVRSEALCLRVRDYHESSKLVTFFTPEHGKVSCLAKGARRLKSKYGAALDLFAQARIIYYSREARTLFTLSDAELIHSFSGLALSPERFLSAEQMTEFVLRVTQPMDPGPQLYRLLLGYLHALESGGVTSKSVSGSLAAMPQAELVCSFLLKAASFLGFRPELRRCLICRRPVEGKRAAYFEPERGGIICPRCAGDKPMGIRLEPDQLDAVAFLLYTPVSDIASSAPPSRTSPAPILDVVLRFLGHHFDPLVLNSFHWHANLRRDE